MTPSLVELYRRRVGKNDLSTLTIRFLNALVKRNLRFDTARCRFSQSFHVISGKSAEVTGPLTGTDVPTVVAFLHYVHRVAFLQFELVFVLWSIIVESSVPERIFEKLVFFLSASFDHSLI